MRKSVALWLNVLVPGGGLILLRREWLGLVLALLFCLCVQIGLWGMFIVPASIPGWVTSSALFGAVLVWICAQYTLVLRLRQAFGPGIERQIVHLCELAKRAVASGDYARAEEFLEVALTLNDEDPHVNTLWAQLMTALGRFDRARPAWVRVVQLSEEGFVKRQAVEALAALP
ncbi:MAG: tetratricopeptide repeat protein [Phycisphaerae bacterium]|nr:tetratricopeptide repeat protein [Phycisphaerae bacterium]